MDRKSQDLRTTIENGNTIIGIELGSTRIKTILIDDLFMPIASGSFDWENSYTDEIWTYPLDAVWWGLQQSYAAMAADVQKKYAVTLKKARSLGISGMMHGYLVFDQNGQLLTPFRTWRNNITEQASAELTRMFNHPIPQRWGIAHLYQAILRGEEHLPRIHCITTLSGYLHEQLTGQRVLGINDASGLFPVDPATGCFSRQMMERFEQHIQTAERPWRLRDILPSVLMAGEAAGVLTAEGALKLDPSGTLQPGIPLCPPEGDAGTGMVATNSIAPRSGNVSAGTSVFAMIVLEQALSAVHPENDLVMTPDGRSVAMVHSNNCTSDYDAWIGLFSEAIKALGFSVSKGHLYETLLSQALQGETDGGGLLAYGYVAGEHITGFAKGRPLFARRPDSAFNLPNFIRVHLMAALGALKAGLQILTEKERVRIDHIRGHGGFFKTREVGCSLMAAATGVPVSIVETAGEGGAWGIALLAAYMVRKQPDESLCHFLENRVFASLPVLLTLPDPADVAGYDVFFQRYMAGLPIEQAAVRHLE